MTRGTRDPGVGQDLPPLHCPPLQITCLSQTREQQENGRRLLLSALTGSTPTPWPGARNVLIRRGAKTCSWSAHCFSRSPGPAVARDNTLMCVRRGGRNSRSFATRSAGFCPIGNEAMHAATAQRVHSFGAYGRHSGVLGGSQTPPPAPQLSILC